MLRVFGFFCPLYVLSFQFWVFQMFEVFHVQVLNFMFYVSISKYLMLNMLVLTFPILDARWCLIINKRVFIYDSLNLMGDLPCVMFCFRYFECQFLIVFVWASVLWFLGCGLFVWCTSNGGTGACLYVDNGRCSSPNMYDRRTRHPSPHIQDTIRNLHQ